MGTILERLVPCMSGSSKRTLRTPWSFHWARTCSTETDFFSAITMASTPAPVVPGAELQTQLDHEHRDRVGFGPRHDRQHAALATVPTLKSGRQHAWRLQVAALPTQRGVGIVDYDESVSRALQQHRELDEMTDVPVGRRSLDRPPRQLTQQHLGRRTAA